MRRPTILATAMVLPALALGACGGTSSRSTSSGSPVKPAVASPATTSGSIDQDKITAVITAYGQDPTKLCTQFATPAMIRSTFVTKARCMALASAPNAADPAVTVASVTIKGNTATAVRTTGTDPGKGRQAYVYLVKQAGGWKVDSVVPK